MASEVGQPQQRGGVDHAGVQMSTRDVGAALCSVWLLSYYFLPRTVLEHLAPTGLYLSRYPLANAGATNLAVVVLCTITTLYLKRAQSRTSANRAPLWALFLAFWLPRWIEMALLPELSHLRPQFADILAAVSTGLLASASITHARAVPIAVTILASVQAIYAFAYRLAGEHLMRSGELLRAGGTFAQPLYLGILMLAVLPFALLGATQTDDKRLRALWLCAAGTEALCLVLTLDRGATAAMGAGLAMFCYLTTRSKRMTGLVLGGSLLLALGIAAYRASGPVNSASAVRSNAGRIWVGKQAWSLFLQRPLTGVGMNEVRFEKKVVRHGMVQEISLGQPHNLFLYWLDEGGVAGGALLLLWFLAALAILRGVAHRPLAAAVGSAWVSLLVVGFVETPFGPPEGSAGNAVFGLLVGLTAQIPRLLSEQAVCSHIADHVAERAPTEE